METDVIVIGAGPAGSACASILAQKGYSVLILEKNSFPRFSIGESLLPQCMVFLEESGLLEAIPKDSFQVKKGALFAKGEQTAKIDFSQKFSSGPAETWQVTRSDFDQILIDKAQEYGATVKFNTEVKSFEQNDNYATLSVKAGNKRMDLNCRFVIDASGSAMVIPRLLNLVSKPKVSKTSLFCHFENESRSKEENENILISINPKNPKIWYWGIPFKDNKISVGVVSDDETLDTYSEDDQDSFKQLISEEPHLARRLKNAKTSRPLQKIKAYEAAVNQSHGDRFLLVGNASGFIDPIFSSGLTVALKSAVLGTKEVLSFLENQSPKWQEYNRQMNIGNDTFRAYVEAWYDTSLQEIILTQNKEEDIQKKINSILAGYVWDTENSFVREPARKLKQVSQLIKRYSAV